MFCCKAAKNRLRGVGIFGILLSVAIISFWASESTNNFLKKQLSHDNRIFEETLMPLDLISASLSLLGSILLLCAASAPPQRMLSAEDIYSTNTAIKSTSSRRLLEVSDQLDMYESDDNDTTPMGLYRSNFARAGMKNPRGFSGRMGRFLTHNGAAALITLGAVRLSYYIRHSIWDHNKHQYVTNIQFSVAGVCLLIPLFTLVVLYFVDPARIPNPPAQESANAHNPQSMPDSLSFLGNPMPSYGNNNDYYVSYANAYTNYPARRQ